MPQPLPIIDSFGRVHRNLRISVTDRCNIRCTYCMPEQVTFLPQKQLLTFEEIARFVKLLVPLGVDRIRLTGGEPLIRSSLATLVRMLKEIPGLRDVALTTNGVLLDQQAVELREAGVDRLNISLDTIDRELFLQITRRDVLHRVLAGIEAAQSAGFENIRLNAVPLPSIPESALVALAKFARNRQLELRFIEFMPLDGDRVWEASSVRSGADLLALLSRDVGALEPVASPYLNQPAVNYRYRDGTGSIGLINSVTVPFCATCDRMRITAEGKFRNCLFSAREWDLRSALRDGSEAEVERLVREAILAKKPGHGTDDGTFHRPDKAMYQIGG